MESRKSEIIEAIRKTEDIELVEKLESLVKLNNSSWDWWEAISEGERSAIEEGLEQLARGEVFSHEEVRKGIDIKLGL